LKNNVQYIAIAGNIGVGKSTLTGLLAKHFNWEAFYESVDDNPYLKDFYEDMSRWSFNLQIYFLSSRFKRQKNIMSNQVSFIQDRTIYEDVEIFAKNLHEMALMSDRDYENYKSLFKEMSDYIQPPNLMVYLRASVPTLVKQIQSRGRDYESSIRLDYLERLNNYYDQWIDRYEHEKLIIDTDHLDFVNNQEDLGYVISLIERRIFNLFS
jgi:deoxyadenosine/deoxycytidine kinase